jgi:hypothetical protein
MYDSLYFISKVYDGKIYKQILKSEDDPLLINKRAFTLKINTDEIQISDKSRLSVWPVYFAINELPIEIRFSLENIKIGGISVGDFKSNLSFLKPNY